jgi:ATP-dependent protease ClpP protease subunit
MRLSYFYHGEMTHEETQQALYFLNDCNKSNDGETILDFYIDSPGGSYSCYVVLKDAFENSDMTIRLIGAGDMSSAAFMLFYFCENVAKTLSNNVIGLVHTISTGLEDREMKKSKSHTSYVKKHVDELNAKFIEDVKKNKILSTAQIKALEAGEDVMLLREDLYKIMLKCPYGTFLKDGEYMTIESK